MAQFRDDVTNHAISWMDLHRDSKQLAKTLVGIGTWYGLIAITRGGLVPAGIIARELNFRKIDTLCVASYDEQVQTDDLSVIKAPEEAIAAKGKGWLVIDDLVDTGKTIQYARTLLPDAHFATVYAKAQGARIVDSYVRDFPQNTWLYFPWDTEVQYVSPLIEDRLPTPDLINDGG